MPLPRPELLAIVAAAAALISAALIVLLRPLLVRYAMARPNARSSHREPTPQGGGIAVIAAMFLVVAGIALAAPAVLSDPFRLAVVFAATAGLAIVGAVDDMRPLGPTPRLILQAVAVGAVIAALPTGLRVFPELPWWLERAGLLIGGIWFVNLVNFMDGIDWITVAETVPLTAALVLFGAAGALPADATLVAMALCGAMIGFAPFNRPVAQLFLGDIGSLPIGLLMTWLLILLAQHHLAAALLLPLYYLADATVTLLRRLIRGERITQAHRNHFYQQAVDGKLRVLAVVGRIFATNIGLAGLAAATFISSAAVQALIVACGAGLVLAVLITFGRSKRAPVA
ncbi:MAG: glycosyl transferase [Pseudolabrys sp.]|jgi:UDP-N-acetylmuramyl pentapeptide phosphotransferase/UDP-N-acetylglucosamine-1-phosphate transferase